MHRKIIYLVNPVSGVKKKSALLELIILRNKKEKTEYDIIYTNPDGDYAFLREIISRDRVTDVVICGGDGTVNAVAAELTGIDVNIGIIPSASGNGLAFAAKIPRQSHAAISVVLQGRAAPIDAFYVNNLFSCMLCGIGFDALVAHDFARQKRRGLQTYIRVSLSNFLRARPYAFTVETEGHSFSTSAFLISIANSNQFGNNFTIAPKASLSDGLLDIVIIKEMSKFRLPFSLLYQVAGINKLQAAKETADEKNIMYFQTPSLRVINPGGAPLHIDGEPQTSAGQFDIRIVRNAMNLIQP